MIPKGHLIRGLQMDFGRGERSWNIGMRDAGRLREISLIVEIECGGQMGYVVWYRVFWSDGSIEDVNGAAVTVVYYGEIPNEESDDHETVRSESGTATDPGRGGPGNRSGRGSGNPTR